MFKNNFRTANMSKESLSLSEIAFGIFLFAFAYIWAYFEWYAIYTLLKAFFASFPFSYDHKHVRCIIRTCCLDLNSEYSDKAVSFDEFLLLHKWGIWSCQSMESESMPIEYFKKLKIRKFRL